MHLPLTAGLAELVIVEEVGSTNDELLAIAHGAPEFTAVVTTSQTGGRGRLGRTWVAPSGEGLAISLLLRPRLPAGEPLELTRWGWIPLMAGVAMTRTVASLLPAREVGLKWPNDVLVGGRKVSGILAELLPGGDGLVLGAGLNLTIPADRLPTPTSTSLAIEGLALRGDELVDAACSSWLREFRSVYTEYLRLGGDEAGSGVLDLVSELCSSLGRQVTVKLPSGENLIGTAIDLDRSGRLRIKRETDGRVQAVAAGDVTHLRYE